MHLLNFGIWLLHPLGYCNGPTAEACRGYNFWSGIGSDFGELTLITAAIAWYIHNQCHVSTCRKIGKYPFKHFKLCKKHHPGVPNKLTHLDIKKLHKGARVK